MGTYTVDQLCEDGHPFAMAMLLRCLKAGESFVTYGAISKELEYQLNIKTIFPTQIGHVAGSLMDQILKIDPKAPLINSLITRPDGIPGKGVGWYFAYKYGIEDYRDWDKVPRHKKRELINKERKKVFLYGNWQQVNKKLFGTKALSKLRTPRGTEIDGFSPSGKYNHGPAESKEHKGLKEWVAVHPGEIGLKKSFGKGEQEAVLLSGDTVDVLFSRGNEYVTVEVKSCWSNDEDFRRGIYQCVKYRKVKEAEHLPNEVTVLALLVTEREMNIELKKRAHLLNVGFKCVYVNKKKR
jgi:hypothetical protein